MPTPKAPKKKPANGQMPDDRTLAEIVGDQKPAPEATYTFSDGTTVRLNGIPPLMFIGAQSTVGRPEAPKRTVKMAGGGVQEVARRDDEPVLEEDEIARLKDEQQRADEQAYREYRIALQQWETNAEYRIARLLFLIGVKDGPPAEEVALMQAIGFTDAYDIKYNWLASKLRTPGDVERFYEDVLSLTMPTEAGQAEAREMFQSAVARGAGGVDGPGAMAEPAGGETAEAGEG